MHVEDQAGDDGARESVQKVPATPALRRHIPLIQTDSLDAQTSGACRLGARAAAFRAVDIEGHILFPACCSPRSAVWLDRCALGLPEIRACKSDYRLPWLLLNIRRRHYARSTDIRAEGIQTRPRAELRRIRPTLSRSDGSRL